LSTGQSYLSPNLTGVQGATGSTGSTGSAGTNGVTWNVTSVTFPGGNITINWSKCTSTVTFVGPNLTGVSGCYWINWIDWFCWY